MHKLAVQPELPSLSPPTLQRSRPRRGSKGPRRAPKPPPPPTPEELRLAAETLKARKEKRARIRALRIEMELTDERRRTDDHLAEQRERATQVERDERLATLLALRAQGLPVAQAIEEVERRFGSVDSPA